MHQLGPGLHRGRADVWDDLGQGGVFLIRHHYEHADGVAVVGQLDDSISESLRGAGYA